LFFRAQVLVVWVRAGRAEVFVGKFFQRIEITTALVILPVAIREVFDGGVALHTVFAAKGLVNRAVNVSDQDGLGIRKSIT